MPKVYNEDQSGLVSIMPCFVLKAVVKDIGFTFDLLFCLQSNPHLASGYPHQRQMKTQFFIGRAVMLHNVRVSSQSTDKRMMVVVGNVLMDKLHGEW